MYSPRIAYLEYAMATKTAFVCYRMPDENDFVTLLLNQKNPCIEFDSFGEISDKEGFVFTPFARNKKTPSLLINYEEICVNDKGFRGDMFLDKNIGEDKSNISENSERKSDYADSFDKMYALLESEELQKIVLSRTITVDNIEEEQAVYTFHNLAKTYQNAFVYWVYLPCKGIVWMGATPELLLRKSGEDLHTMSLAGTKLPNEIWQQKECDEQAFVTQYLQESLNDYQVEISNIETVKHGEIEHLMNRVVIRDSVGEVSNVLEKIHPTPAVCGLPKNKAYDTIKSLEKHDREYYSGIVGLWNMKNTALFVNLRCMKYAKRKVQMFVGGGLTKASRVEQEWQETERKASTIQRAFC